MTLDHATSQRVYDRLKADLLHGSISGTAPINIAALAREYDVSPTPIREALLRLVGERFVDLRQRGGFDVVSPSPDIVRELLLLRFHLLALAVDQLAHLPPLLARRRFSDALGCPVAAASAADLIDALARASRHTTLIDLLSLLRDRLQVASLKSPPDGHVDPVCLARLRDAMDNWHAARLKSALVRLHAAAKTCVVAEQDLGHDQA